MEQMLQNLSISDGANIASTRPFVKGATGMGTRIAHPSPVRSGSEFDELGRREGAVSSERERCGRGPIRGPVSSRISGLPLLAWRLVEVLADGARQRAAGVGFLEEARLELADGVTADIVQAVTADENGLQARFLRP
jgi:hypothetical protein